MALGYLISPALQLEDINGKPLTGGWLNVYVHGTLNRAVTYKDYSGNLNANDIVLNDKGMAVVIADSEHTYDVYCYDRHGVDQWSRLNVCTIGSGSGGGGGEEYYAGNGILIDGANTISVDPSTVQGKLTTGGGVEIVNNEIGLKVDNSTIMINVDGELEANFPQQVNADWNATTGKAEILNKPTIPDSTSDLTNDSGYITLSDVPAQQQANWAETDTSSPSYIQNKPADLPAIAGHAGDALIVNSQETGLEWGTPTAELYEAVYGTTTYAQVTQAIAEKKIVYCRVPQSGSAVRMAFLAYVGSNNAEFQYYRSKSSRTYSAPTDEVYVYTVNASGWTTTTRNTGYAIAAGTGLNYSISGGTLTLSEANPLPTVPVSSYKNYSLMYSTYPSEMSMSWSLSDSRIMTPRGATVGLNSYSRIEITQYMLDHGVAYFYLDKTAFPDIGGGYQWWDVKLWGIRFYKQTADASLAGTEWDIQLMLTTSQIATPHSDSNTDYLSTLRFKWESNGLFTDYQGFAFTADLLNSDTVAMFIKLDLTSYTGSLAVGDEIYIAGAVRPCTNIM